MLNLIESRWSLSKSKLRQNIYIRSLGLSTGPLLLIEFLRSLSSEVLILQLVPGVSLFFLFLGFGLQYYFSATLNRLPTKLEEKKGIGTKTSFYLRVRNRLKSTLFLFMLSLFLGMTLLIPLSLDSLSYDFLLPIEPTIEAREKNISLDSSFLLKASGKSSESIELIDSTKEANEISLERIQWRQMKESTQKFEKEKKTKTQEKEALEINSSNWSFAQLLSIVNGILFLLLFLYQSPTVVKFFRYNEKVVVRFFQDYKLTGFGLAIFAGVITPTLDAVTQITLIFLLSTIYFLYKLTINKRIISFSINKRRN